MVCLIKQFFNIRRKRGLYEIYKMWKAPVKDWLHDMKNMLVFAIIWNVLIFVATQALLSFYAMAEETKRLTILLVLVHNIFNAIAFPFADPLGKGLRAAGDARFTTALSLFTTIVEKSFVPYLA